MENKTPTEIQDAFSKELGNLLEKYNAVITKSYEGLQWGDEALVVVKFYYNGEREYIPHIVLLGNI